MSGGIKLPDFSKQGFLLKTRRERRGLGLQAQFLGGHLIFKRMRHGSASAFHDTYPRCLRVLTVGFSTSDLNMPMAGKSAPKMNVAAGTAYCSRVNLFSSLGNQDTLK